MAREPRPELTARARFRVGGSATRRRARPTRRRLRVRANVSFETIGLAFERLGQRREIETRGVDIERFRGFSGCLPTKRSQRRGRFTLPLECRSYARARRFVIAAIHRSQRA